MTTFFAAVRQVATASIALFMLAVAAAAEETRPTSEEASAFVKGLAERAIAVISNEGLGAEGRTSSLGVLLDEGFELDVIGRFVAGRFWTAATPDQQSTYRTLFRAFVLKKYAALLSQYSGQQFVVSRAVEAGERDVVVSTEIIGTGDPVRTDWRVRKFNGVLKVIDVKVEGISMLTSQREEFASVIRQRGFDGLLELLRDQTEGSA